MIARFALAAAGVVVLLVLAIAAREEPPIQSAPEIPAAVPAETSAENQAQSPQTAAIQTEAEQQPIDDTPQPRIIWGVDPVRVDPDASEFHRIAPKQSDDPFPLTLHVPRSVNVPDNTTFSFDGKTYRVGNVAPIDPRTICRGEGKLRWACGARARIEFRNMVAGEWLKCRIIEQWGPDHVVDCKFGETTFSAVLARKRSLASHPIDPAHN